MTRRLALLVFSVALVGLVTAGATGLAVAETEPTPTGTLAAPDDDLVEPCAATPPDDFADPADGNATIGWFDGYWYDEPLEIDASDGITPEELEKLSARTAARFEAMRCLPFEELPPVEIRTREEFAEETREAYAEVDEETRLFDNARLETLLLVGSDEDAIDVREEDRTVSVGGYYDFIDERIVVISDDPETLLIDEAILAHELGHALQDQHFDLERYVRDTTDRDKGKLGMIEGDVHRVEQAYLERCTDERWSEPCVTGTGSAEEAAADLGDPPSWGLHFLEFQPYSDGPSFADHRYEQGGWDAVDAVYEEMPQSSLFVIYPEKYGELEVDPHALAVEDTSTGDWERLEADLDPADDDEPASPNYDVIGQAGLSAILIDPAFDGNPIVQPDAFLNYVGLGEVDPTNPYNYALPETDGWRGDQLHVYHDGAGETATVWKLAWRDAAETTRFLETYEHLVAHRGGERVDGYAHTYTFGDGSDFEMAMTAVPDDDRLWIVAAPTVDDLTDVHDVTLLEAAETDDEGEADDGSETDDTVGTNGEAPGDSDGSPGFTLALAAAALLVSALALSRRD
ncbi:Hvo_1808 family surface protein [Natronobiforma cellulositropha]|uniref:Hvo_1808 family surface protein n=1 Tax=Natronobiforma cellulositropha TaxID=1679076 RepID=UPI0021D5A2BC|nr:Hvo_1808 family surface protein [Natronobiforma cellulositropha]